MAPAEPEPGVGVSPLFWAVEAEEGDRTVPALHELEEER